MRALILGSDGMLGHKIVEALSTRLEVYATVCKHQLHHVLTGMGIIDLEKLLMAYTWQGM